MRATIDSEGTLIVEAESELEAYALSEWWENYPCGTDKECKSERPTSLHIEVTKIAAARAA